MKTRTLHAPWRCMLVLLLVSTSLNAAADKASPVGLWKQFDSHGTAKSLVRITESNGHYQGTLIKLLNRSPAEIARNGEHPVCSACSGTRQNQPLVGMTVMRGVTRQGSNRWGGGTVLNPASGKFYRVTLQLDDQGEKLEVRGYIGISLFGHTRVLQRQSAEVSPDG